MRDDPAPSTISALARALLLLAVAALAACQPVPTRAHVEASNPAMDSSPTGAAPYDLAIVGGLTLTMEPGAAPMERSLVLVDDGRIVQVRALAAGETAPAAAVTLDATGMIVVPGLINAHTHVDSTLGRGALDDLPLEQWLALGQRLGNKFSGADVVEAAAELAMLEMIRGGTTTFNDMSFRADVVARVADRAGLRALLSEPLMEGETPTGRTPEQGLVHTVALARVYAQHPRVSVALGPHYPSTCPRPVLEEVARLADRLDLRVHMHVAEVPAYSTIGGVGHVTYLDGLGLLGRRLMAVHAVHVAPSEIELLARRGAGVVHCPESNMKLRDGIAPVAEMVRQGVTVALGSDGATSNNDLDMFEAMDMTAKLQTVDPRRDAPPLDADRVLRMATLDGARVLGMAGQTGSLAPGKLADLIVVDLDAPHLVPLYRPASALVYSAHGSDVRHTVVHGRLLMRDRKVLTLDRAAVLARAHRLSAAMAREIGLKPR